MRLAGTRTTLAALATAVAGLMLAGGTGPAGALNAGGGTGVTLLSPNLTSNFPCNGGGSGLPMDAISRYAAGNSNGYSCGGSLYTTIGNGVPNVAAFSGSGHDVAVPGNTFSFTGAGSVSSSYTYTEPCQAVVPGSPGAEWGDAHGTLVLSVRGSGLFNTTPIDSATISTEFWWSRVGLTAVVALKGSTVSTPAGSLTDPDARGVAPAIFIPTEAPNCTTANVPAAGSVIIASGSLTLG